MPARSSDFTRLFDSLLGPTVGEAVRSALPVCAYCDGRVVVPIPCMVCGDLACLEHGYFSTAKQMVCAGCLEEALEASQEPRGRPAPARGGRGRVREDTAGKASRGRQAARSSYPWSVLGVRPDASLDEVKRAYRALAKQLHPDLGGDQARFTELNDAYAMAEEIVRRRAAAPAPARPGKGITK